MAERRTRVRILAAAAAAFFMLAAAASAAAPAPRIVHAFVIVPSSYVSPITPEQAWRQTILWLGTPADAPCLNPRCSVEGFFRHELGQVFDYDIAIVPGSIAATGTDACGQGGVDGYWNGGPGGGYSFDDNRTFMVVLGGGGWAGHNPMRSGPRKGTARALVGDWEIQSAYGVPVACNPIPPSSDPALASTGRGFAHEFEGMMGAFKGATGTECDYYCCDKPLLDFMRRNLLQYSRDWLRDPS